LTDQAAITVRNAFRHVRTSEVPPVGVEPTLGTLLGGRPLPLGYGGIAMIPRVDLVTLDLAINAGRFKANVVFLIARRSAQDTMSYY